MICFIRDCTFRNCEMDQANLRTSILDAVTFDRCRLDYAIFSRATMTSGGFRSCSLHGAFLDMAESKDVDFRGSNLWGVVLPLSCAVLTGNEFDHRQLHMLFGLLTHAGHEFSADLTMLKTACDPKVLKLVNRIVRDEAPIDGHA